MVSDRRKRNEAGSIGEVVQDPSRDLHSQAGFSDAAGPGERHEARGATAEKRSDVSDFSLPPDQGCGRGWKPCLRR
jgi:hypothetical protein